MLEYHWIFTEIRAFSIVDPTANTSEALQWHWKKKAFNKTCIKSTRSLCIPDNDRGLL